MTAPDPLADVGRHTYAAAGDAELVAELERNAQRDLRLTGRAQAVHLHAHGAPCVAGCVVLRYADA